MCRVLLVQVQVTLPTPRPVGVVSGTRTVRGSTSLFESERGGDQERDSWMCDEVHFLVVKTGCLDSVGRLFSP